MTEDGVGLLPVYVVCGGGSVFRGHVLKSFPASAKIKFDDGSVAIYGNEYIFTSAAYAFASTTYQKSLPAIDV